VLAAAATTTGVDLVQVFRGHCDDVVIVWARISRPHRRREERWDITTEFTGFRREAEVGDLGECDVGNIEAEDPLIFTLVLEFELEVIFLKVG